MRMQAHMLPDGKRLRLHDGPIDLIIGADGSPDQIHTAYRAATYRFATILDELCGELPDLRRAHGPQPEGPVARKMWQAVLPYCEERFITPMAAVAGAVAEEILGCMTEPATLDRAYVNNGGDIALHLAGNAALKIGLVDRCERPSLFATTVITADHPCRGVATSGRGGRSFSLGIADAVTVLAASAPDADTAATVIANDVDLPGHPGILRRPACELQPDSDLRALPVTVDVVPLRADEVEEALDRGVASATSLLARGLILAAALHLQGRTRCVGASDGKPQVAIG
jgi:ApbE superfamily uncharacterized protein (UPF0280 family)